MDIYDNCKKCGFRIGSHSINESYRCGLIKLKPIYNDFNPKMINLFIKSREEEKEEDKEDENPNKGCDACGDDNNGYGMFLYREGKYSYCAGCMDVGWKKKENKNIEKK